MVLFPNALTSLTTYLLSSPHGLPSSNTAWHARLGALALALTFFPQITSSLSSLQSLIKFTLLERPTLTTLLCLLCPSLYSYYLMTYSHLLFCLTTPSFIPPLECKFPQIRDFALFTFVSPMPENRIYSNRHSL